MLYLYSLCDRRQPGSPRKITNHTLSLWSPVSPVPPTSTRALFRPDRRSRGALLLRRWRNRHMALSRDAPGTYASLCRFSAGPRTCAGAGAAPHARPRGRARSPRAPHVAGAANGEPAQRAGWWASRVQSRARTVLPCAQYPLGFFVVVDAGSGYVASRYGPGWVTIGSTVARICPRIFAGKTVTDWLPRRD